MSSLKHTAVTHLHLTALPESKLGDCMREAVLTVCREWRNVTLTYRDRKYRVLCNDLLTCVVESGDKPGSDRNAC